MEHFIVDYDQKPLMGDCVMAGFPFPAEQYEFA